MIVKGKPSSGQEIRRCRINTGSAKPNSSASNLAIDGRPRVDDRRVITGIVHVIRKGMRWRMRLR
jgi:hypothetical protein